MPARYDILSSPGTNLRYGFYAIAGRACSENLRIRTGKSCISLDDRPSFFAPDQLAAVIGVWGERRGYNLSLGLRRENGPDFIFPAADRPGPRRAIWVPHHNAGSGRYSSIGHSIVAFDSQAPHVAMDGGSSFSLSPTIDGSH